MRLLSHTRIQHLMLAGQAEFICQRRVNLEQALIVAREDVEIAVEICSCKHTSIHLKPHVL